MDISRPFDGAALTAFLSSLPARPRLLGLGEARHFVAEHAALRNDAFRHLVEHEGYRAIAMETDCLRAQLVDDYVTTGSGDLDDLLDRGFSHGFGASPGVRDLLTWMRAHNRDREDPLRFFGIDGPLEYWAHSPREALAGLHALLDPPVSWDTVDTLLGADTRWTDEATVLDPSRSIGRSDDARRLRLITDDLLALLATRVPQLSTTDRQRAELYGRTAVGLLRYHDAMADPSPERLSRLSALRDAMMAANLLAVADHGPALVFAHNLHLQRPRSELTLGDQTVRMWSAGAISAAYLGDRYAYLACAVGAIGDHVPPAGTIEAALSALPWDRALVDARRLTGPFTMRTSPDYAYFPLDPTHLATIDGIVFLRQVAAPG